MEFEKWVALHKWSDIANENVTIARYRNKSSYNTPLCNCDFCGKPIIRTLYVVQSDDTDVELFYLGPECIKKFH